MNTLFALLKGAQAWDIRLQVFFHKSDLYVLVIQELGEKIQNFDGLGLKIAVLYFLALSPTSLTFLSAIGDDVKKL